MSEQFAFWKYDGFPYLLGGTVTKMDDTGRVETKEYGKGFWFMPVKILPVNAGKRMLAKLEELRKKHSVAEKEFRATWKQAANHLKDNLEIY